MQQVPPSDCTAITGLILAGGQGQRMGGIDKGLQLFRGLPLAQHALNRLAQQAGGPLHGVLINANRNAERYMELMQRSPWGQAQVVPDAVQDFAGPLAGFLAGLQHCTTPYLLTVPCDSPLFPLDMAQRLLAALQAQDSDVAMVVAPERGSNGGSTLRSQPVFCLLKTSLLPSLKAYMQGGGRKIDSWTRLQRIAEVAFDQPRDDLLAFANVNTLDDLRALESQS